MADEISRANHCAVCDLLLQEPVGTPMDQRNQCPSCGSLGRTVRQTLNSTVTFQGYFTGLQERAGRAIGFRETPRDGRVSTAQSLGDGTVEFALHGSSPQGEEDTLPCCRILIERLRLAGEPWEEPQIGTANVDCFSRKS